MLLKKKKFHLIYFIKKLLNNNKILNYNLFYVCNKKNLINFFSGFNVLLFLKKKKFINYYAYSIQIKISNKIIFNSILIIFLNLMRIILCPLFIYEKFKFNFFKTKQKKFSFIRSPFIYKRSQEQLAIIRNKGSIFICIEKYNFFFIQYIEFFFKSFYIN